ncbi:MAG: lipase family protein [Isosphaeraceae bacterium]
MSARLFVEGAGNPRNSEILATACELAYYPESQGRELYQSKLGLDAQFVSVDNTQVYVGQNDTDVVVAFRGSESPDTIDGFKDWLLTNANNFLILPEGRIGTDFAAAGVGARFHKGFLEALDEIWAPFFAAVDKAIQAKDRPVWVTGHSLGGALALLAAWRLVQNFIGVHEIHTFGAPMIGNDAAAKAFEGEFPNKIFRYVNDLDLVPLLPTVSLTTNSYAHCLREMILRGQAETSAASAVLQGFASRTIDGILNATLIDDIWSCMKDRIAYHMVSSYQQRIKER